MNVRAMHRGWSVVLLMLALLAPALPVAATPAAGPQTYTVTTTDDTPDNTNTNCAASCTLRQAVNASNANDPGSGANTIMFALSAGPLTIFLNTNAQHGTLTLSAPVAINGPGASNLAIDGGHTTGPTGVQVFLATGGTATQPVTLSGLTVQNGFGSGAGIHNNGTLVVTSCTMSNNAGGTGNGIFNDVGGTLTVTNSTLSGNTGGGSGGGGGIFNKGGTVTVAGSTLSGNMATGGFGGGIRNQIGGTLTVTNSTLSGNSAGYGGGIYNDGGTVTVTGSTLSDNRATDGRGGSGGGLYNFGGTVVVTNSTLSNNQANSISGGSGGGINNQIGGTLTVTNSTLSGNAGFSGGGIVIGDRAATLTNTIVANSPGGDLYGSFGGGNNLISDDGANSSGFTDGVNGNIVGHPALLGPLANNGGTTQTFALQPGSLALKAADSATCAANVFGAPGAVAPYGAGGKDQIGTARPQPPGDATCDIGAFESALPPPAPALTLAFVPNPIRAGGASTLTATLATVARRTNVSFTETLSAPLTFLGLPTNSCASGSATISGQTLTVSGITLGYATSCTISVDVTSATAIVQSMQSSAVSSTESGPGSPSNSATLTVTAGTLAKFAVSALAGTASGTPVSVTVTAQNRDGGTITDYTGTIHFTTSDTAAGVVVPRDYTFIPADNGAHTFTNGVTFRTPGTQTITATDGGITGQASVFVSGGVLRSIAVTPAASSIAKGTTQQFTATGTYSDGSTQNLTSSVAWASTSTGVAANPPNGLATGANAGTTTITASQNGVTSTGAALTVTAATLTNVTVSPSANPVIARGATLQFTATGTFSDGTTQPLSGATWQSGTPATATIDATGKATAANVGTTGITASFGGRTSAPVTLTVTTAALTGLAVAPTSATIARGATRQFVATATYSDSTAQDVTSSAVFGSSNTGVASVSNAIGSYGVATGQGAGTATITATYGGLTSNGAVLTVTVADVTLRSIAVAGPGGATTPVVKIGQTVQLTATGTYTDNTTRDLTGQAQWSADSPGVAAVDATGKVIGQSAGTATITASFGGTQGQMTVTVAAPVVTGAQPAPIPVGRSAGAGAPVAPGGVPPVPAPAPPSR